MATLVVAADQLTKSIVLEAIGPGRHLSRRDVVEGWISLEYAENRGAAFGLFSGLSPVLVLASVAILAGVLVQFFRTPSPSPVVIVSVGAIVGGAVGNLVDRVRLGYVVDFVAIGPWPNFNIADGAITLGVLGLVWVWTRPEHAGRGG